MGFFFINNVVSVIRSEWFIFYFQGLQFVCLTINVLSVIQKVFS